LKVHGLLLLDKPRGLSSNAALQKARRLFDADKAGHGGTLDPMADGLLPVMFGEACKLAESALEGDKAYQATMRLGQTTTTDDTEGEIMSTAPVSFSDADLEAVLARFRGRIVQVPPVYSALKVAGKALYRYARDGNPVQAAPREVTIHGLRLLARRGGDEPSLSIDVACSKGTYIRSLARDIGAALGCGAHLSALRRTAVGRFSVEAAVSLDALAAATPQERHQHLVGLEELVCDWPSIVLDEADAARFRQGQAIVVAQGALHLPAATPPAATPAAATPAAAEARPASARADELPGDGSEPLPKIAVHCGGRLIGLGRCTSTTESTCALAPVRIIVS
jgi:tRNA pseudouridine55 synthase